MNPLFDRNLYAIFGVEPDASVEDIRAVRDRLLRRYHPDKGGPSESAEDRSHWTRATAELNAAWDILGNADARAEYDAYRASCAEDSAGFDGADEPPPDPPASPADPGSPPGILGLAAAVAGLLLFALWAESSFWEQRARSLVQEVNAERAAADERRAVAVLSLHEGWARDARRLANEASSAFWAAVRDYRGKQAFLAAARLAPADRARQVACSAGSAGARAGAVGAAGLEWLLRHVDWRPFQRAADWAAELQASARVWAEAMRSCTDRLRLGRRVRVGALSAEVEAARRVYESARTARSQAADSVALADGRVRRARSVLASTRAYAERAYALSLDSAGDRAQARAFASGAWVFAFVSVGWMAVRRQALAAGRAP